MHLGWHNLLTRGRHRPNLDLLRDISSGVVILHSLWVGTGHVENKLLRIFSHQGIFSMTISLMHKATNSVGFGKYLQIVSLIFKLHSKSIIFLMITMILLTGII